METQPQPLKLVIALPGYLGKSPNRTHGSHWSLQHKERAKARAALLSALQDAPADLKIRTIFLQAAKRLLTSSDMPVSSQTIGMKTSD
jgi:hypothetical protein